MRLLFFELFYNHLYAHTIFDHFWVKHSYLYNIAKVIYSLPTKKKIKQLQLRPVSNRLPVHFRSKCNYFAFPFQLKCKEYAQNKRFQIIWQLSE